MVMATSVKMDEATKDRLEELQALVKLETGTKVTQQELLKVLVDEAYASRDEVLDHFRTGDDWEGLSEEEIEAFLSWTFSSGEPVDEDDIDRILYDEEQE